jgi:putative endonuclease
MRPPFGTRKSLSPVSGHPRLCTLAPSTVAPVHQHPCTCAPVHPCTRVPVHPENGHTPCPSPPIMAINLDRITLGKSGENYACRELERRGYAIVARRFRTRSGELDIVARDGETLVFVEVKARRTSHYGTPVEAVTAFKRRRLLRMAAEYVLLKGVCNASCRFDVVSVRFGEGLRPRVEVLKNAFDARG